MLSIKRLLNIIVNLPRILIGVAIVKLPFFQSYKLHVLSTWHDYDKRSKIDNFLFSRVFSAWQRFEYLREINPDKREDLKAFAMGGTSGLNWAKSYNNKPLDLDSTQVVFGNMTLRESTPMYDVIETILSNTESNYLVIQAGSSSGRELACFATMFPQHQYLGTDIYKEVIEYASSHNSLPNLSFTLVSVKNISRLLSSHRSKDIILYSSGVLTYVQPEHLCEFFRSLVDYPGLKILISEPANESQGRPDELRKSIWRGEFSYTHDYKYYAEESGIETLECKIIKPYLPYNNFPSKRNTVHYFYYGTIKR